ncbi:hypothetical protein H4219_003678 [Mycoemilia scoparia]|uniref:SAGA-associated factor 11 n=1 Tax=Mycoemilia scoparia TaxID=417184 RepID=A0A9W8A232_9FUNG|nr:hypothetical protein H4219_003678 [Mycoemilia scoparia]
MSGNNDTLFQDVLAKLDDHVQSLKRLKGHIQGYQAEVKLAKTRLQQSASSRGNQDGEDETAKLKSKKYCRATLALEIFGQLIDDLTIGVVYESHQEVKNVENICHYCSSRTFPPTRYAAHLDKCMGLSGRRTASRSFGALGEMLDRSAAVSGGNGNGNSSSGGGNIYGMSADSSGEYVEKKRKPNGGREGSLPIPRKKQKSYGGSSNRSSLHKSSFSRSLSAYSNGGGSSSKNRKHLSK